MDLPYADQPIREASTVCVLRPGAEGLEVLMVRRAVSSAFVGGAYVFPGGAVDAADRSDTARRIFGDGETSPWLSAGVRETAEEAGVVIPAGPGQPAIPRGVKGSRLLGMLDHDGYVFDERRFAYLSNWVTPKGQPRRFDTRFFVTDAPAGLEAAPDAAEVTEAVWVTPHDALAYRRERGWTLIDPTVATLKLLGAYEDPGAVLAFAERQVSVPRIEPRIVMRFGSLRLLMPGDPGYDEAGE
ncbi:NUDIX domain protein [bacterium BMS3Abin02]|nr:NUDIX domain protein [bacterium BMS3Abin02]GBE23048.1 NUDIX domain protein [bacterium BMS3Bbin01]HDH27108.1 NUDIX hydrolase [Actinomycetota bacterium]HDK45029.1 NUDIX hydrolase [Actinomycetota bacterium]HDL50193.1 NUDIX hydrolase [Actinomycetota bacterium]